MSSGVELRRFVEGCISGSFDALAALERANEGERFARQTVQNDLGARPHDQDILRNSQINGGQLAILVSGP